MMKHFYSLMLLLGISTMYAQQHHISEIGIPVEDIETTELTKQDPPIQTTITEDTTVETEAIGGPIAIKEADYTGASKGSFSVSLTGAATYSLPLEVPPGINGIEPKIGITYNSQAGNSTVGYGWNISGLSAISRVGSNKFFDGKNSLVNYSTDDRFMLDGQRLLLKSGTYGKDGAEYQTETYNNLKITSHGNLLSNDSPEYFKVQYPDGSIAFYGQSYSTIFVGQIAESTRTSTVYALTYVTNPQGISIRYHYINDGNNLLISSIEYGDRTTNPLSGIKSLNGTNKISFTYKNRARTETGYTSNKASKLSKILDKITVYGFSGIGYFAQNYKSYQLTYKTTSLGYEQLQKITETSGDGTLSKTPVTFTYGADTSEKTELFEEEVFVAEDIYGGGFSNLSSKNMKVIPGNFSGSGDISFLLYHTSINDDNQQKTIGDRLHIYNPDLKRIKTLNFSTPFNEVVATNSLNYDNILLPNQGWTTITKTSSNISGPSTFKLNSYIYMPEYYGEVATLSTKEVTLREDLLNPMLSNTLLVRKYFMSGDFDGDGISEIIRLRHPWEFSNSSYNVISDDVDVINVKDANPVVNTTTSVSTGFDYLIVDTDGDGYDELVVIRHKNIRIYKYNLNTKKLELYSDQPTNDVLFGKPVYHGDFNGDGKLDFVTPLTLKDQSTKWVFYINKGGGDFNHFIQELGVEFPFKDEDKIFNGDQRQKEHYDFIFTDFNNDGKTDILKFYSYSRTSIKNHTEEGPYMFAVWAYENLKFDDVTKEIAFSVPPTYQYLEEPTRRDPLFCFSNYNQRAYKSELALITDDKLKILSSKKNNVLTQQLNAINEADVTTRITYDSYDEKKDDINNDSEDGVLPFISFDDSMSVYPKVDIDVAPEFYLVKKVTYDTNKSFRVIGVPSEERKQLFSYADATMSHNGKGFLGFRGHMSTNIYKVGSDNNKLKDQIKSATVFDLDNNSLVKEQVVAHGKFWFNFFSSPVNFITKQSNTYNILTGSNKVFRANNTESTVQEGLTGVQRTVKTVFDSYSNPTSVTETVTEGGESSVLNTSYTYLNNAVNDNYYIGRPASKTVKVNNVQTSNEVYTYNNHLLTNISKQAAIGSSAISETNEYDLYGNVIKKTISASDIQPRVASYVYDSSGRYLVKSVDTEGLETSYAYNVNKGWLLSETNPYGLTNSFEYNAMGMVTSETDYLGNTTTYSYKTNGPFILGDFYIKKETTYPDGHKERTITNGWGNKTSEAHTDIEGNYIFQLLTYDSQDRLIKKSEPYTTTASLFTTFEYDDYGRVVKSVLPTGREITSSYSGLSTTVNDGVKTRTETKNVNNQTKKVVDNGETINYVYNPNGTLKNTNYSGTVIGFEYDAWGRKSKMTDPSAGTYTYEYNSIGDLLKETTPNGTTTNTYDATGKITNTTYPDNTITYTYTADKLLNKVTTSTANGQYEEQYTYDNYKRIVSKKNSTPQGFNYTYSYTFDNLGRGLTEEKKVTGPSGTDSFKTKNAYKNGYLWKLQNANTNTDLKVYNNFNERGQVTNFALANGLVTNRTYDAFGYLTENTVSKNSVQQFAFTNTWDVQRGNLTARTNGLFAHGMNETFQYDSFDRLTSNITKQGTSVFAQEQNSYDGKGRILSNNVGDYGYDSSKVYQLQNVDNLNDLAYYQNNPLQQVTYNAHKAPLSIKQQGKENIYFHYDGLDNRVAMYYGNEAADYTQSSKVRYYAPAGDIEIDFDKATNKYIVNIFVDGDAYSSSIIQRKENNATAMYYLHRDYLGSILAITNSAGTLVEKRHFDAWGNVLLVQDGQGNVLDKLTFLERGYTGHEHLQGVGLINMNARLYDAKLHRFLAPDNYVQDPGNPQNYNLYGYGFNNPLKYTDPSGNYAVFDDIIAAAIGGTINLITNWNNIDNFGEGLAAFGAGAFAGWASIYPEFGGLVAGGAVVGGTNAWLSGQDIAQGAMMGGVTSAVGGALGSWISGGVSSAVQGISSPVLKEALSYGIGGGIVGGTLNFGTTLLTTGSFANSIDAFGSGFGMGFATGSIIGATTGYINARAGGLNPLNGKPLSAPTGSAAVDKALTPNVNENNSQFRSSSIKYRRTSDDGFVSFSEEKLAITDENGTIVYTKSSLTIGQAMHKAYKLDIADEINFIKEFRLPSGKKIDFLDIPNRTIYEYKPFNQRSINLGIKQLQIYHSEIQTIQSFQGTDWKLILETY